MKSLFFISSLVCSSIAMGAETGSLRFPLLAYENENQAISTVPLASFNDGFAIVANTNQIPLSQAQFPQYIWLTDVANSAKNLSNIHDDVNSLVNLATAEQKKSVRSFVDEASLQDLLDPKLSSPLCYTGNTPLAEVNLLLSLTELSFKTPLGFNIETEISRIVYLDSNKVTHYFHFNKQSQWSEETNDQFKAELLDQDSGDRFLSESNYNAMLASSEWLNMKKGNGTLFMLTISNSDQEEYDFLNLNHCDTFY